MKNLILLTTLFSLVACNSDKIEQAVQAGDSTLKAKSPLVGMWKLDVKDMNPWFTEMNFKKTSESFIADAPQCELEDHHDDDFRYMFINFSETTLDRKEYRELGQNGFCVVKEEIINYESELDKGYITILDGEGEGDGPDRVWIDLIGDKMNVKLDYFSGVYEYGLSPEPFNGAIVSNAMYYLKRVDIPREELAQCDQESASQGKMYLIFHVDGRYSFRMEGVYDSGQKCLMFEGESGSERYWSDVDSNVLAFQSDEEDSSPELIKYEQVGDKFYLEENN